MDSITDYRQEVTVTDINMPFWSMVTFMVKWTIAAIPAFLILTFFFSLVFVFVTMFLGNLGANLRH